MAGLFGDAPTGYLLLAEMHQPIKERACSEYDFRGVETHERSQHP